MHGLQLLFDHLVGTGEHIGGICRVPRSMKPMSRYVV